MAYHLWAANLQSATPRGLRDPGVLGSGLVDVAFSRGVGWLGWLTSFHRERFENKVWMFGEGIENAEFFNVFFEVGRNV